MCNIYEPILIELDKGHLLSIITPMSGTISSALFREAHSKRTIGAPTGTNVLQNSFTNLASNDWRINDKLDDLVEQLVQEADAGVQQGPSQRHHAAL